MQMTNTDEKTLEDLSGKHILFYDGLCGLCNSTVQFVLEYDKENEFLFAPLQSDFAEKTLRERGADATNLDTVYVLTNFRTPRERLLSKSDAAVFFMANTRHWSRPFSTILSIIPRVVRNFGYDLVARFRYRIFGKYEQCKIPSPEERAKFIAEA